MQCTKNCCMFIHLKTQGLASGCRLKSMARSSLWGGNCAFGSEKLKKKKKLV